MRQERRSIWEAFVAVLALTLSLVLPPESSAAENWSLTGPMTVARAQHTATVLFDGRVLVAGGNNAGGMLQQAEVFHPTSGTWTAVAPMMVPRTQHTATLLADGRVLVAGGSNSSGATRSAEIFTPGTNSWTAVALMSTPRFQHTAALLPDGRVLVVGGSGSGGALSSAEIFDPSTNTWSAAAGMLTVRFQHTAIALTDGRILVAGGQASGGSTPVYCNSYCTSCYRCGLFSTCCSQYVCGQYICGYNTSTSYHASAELYDPATNSWSAAGAMSAGRTLHAAIGLPTGHVLVAGGMNQNGELAGVEEYDPVANAWSSDGAMGTARSRLTGAALSGGRVLLAGGASGGAVITTGELFASLTGAWSGTPAMTVPRADHATVTLQDGRVLVSGGISSNSTLATAEVYGEPVASSVGVSPVGPTATSGDSVQFTARATYTDFSMRTLTPDALAWTPAPAMPTPRSFPMAAAMGDRLYVAGGFDGAAASPRLEAYDPATHAWMARAPLPAADGTTGRYGGAIGAIESRLYVAGGMQTQSSPYSATSSLLIYDSATDAWSLGPSMPTQSACAAGGTIGGKFYVVTGCDAYGYTAGLHAFDSSINAWTTLSSPPHIHASAAAGVIDGKLYVAGGLDGSQASGVLDVYDPQTGVWTTLAPMPTPRWGLGGGVLDGKLYAVGGWNGSSSLATVEVYDPATGSWSANSPLSTARSGAATAAVDGQVLAVGGRYAALPLSTLETAGREVLWSSSDPGVAPIAPDGHVIAGSPGSATITARVGAASGTTALTVIPVVAPQAWLHVSPTGTGTGSVTSSPAGIACGTACSASFDLDTVVTLTATAAAGSRFTGWGGACSGSDPVCTVTVSAETTVTATFAVPDPLPIEILTAGSGAGSVTSTPAGISCPGSCTASFAVDSRVSLWAVPAVGSVFAGWSGGCSGSGACGLSMTEARSVTATFVQVPAFADLRYTVLYPFTGSNGAGPYAGLVQASDGYLYGTTSQGGAGIGTVFRVSPTGDFSIIKVFTGGDGAYPMAGLVQASDGYLYGTTSQGGAGYGTIFRITPGGSFTLLKSFYGFDGASPYARLVQGSDGNLYGTTYAGGTANLGTLFCLTLAGEFTTLKSFLQADGANPYAGLVQASDGNLYGTTLSGGAANLGTVFRLTPGSPATVTTVKSFSGSDGLNPYGGLVQGRDGALYGTTSAGGASNLGTVYRITTDGSLTTLASFSGVNGASPRAGLVEGSDGLFYGTTVGGGTSGGGTIFSLTTGGVLTTLYTFSGAAGAVPRAGLIQGRDGNFYGTASSGGPAGAGVVFVLRRANGLTVNLAGAGAGSVTSAPAGIDCGGTCSASFPAGSSVTLTLSAAAGSQFTGWAGCDSTNGSSCTVAMTATKSVTATFAPAYTVGVAATGTGTITSNIGGIDCGSNCTSAPLAGGTSVTLTAQPASGASFTGWGGDCASVGTNPTCTLTVDGVKSVTAGFSVAPTSYTLTVATAGTGSGTVGTNPTGPSYPAGTSVTLTATPTAGSTFVGWSGDCAGTQPTCVLTMSAARSVTATFAPAANAPVAYWTFDDDTAGDSMGKHPGTIIGSGVTFAAGKVGHAISFGDSLAQFTLGSYMKIPSVNVPYLTVSAWVNAAEADFYTSMVTKNYYATTWTTPYTTWQLWFDGDTGKPGANGSTWNLASPDTIPLNQWVHLAATYDGTTVKLYVNGTEKASTTLTTQGPLPVTDGNIYIGSPEFSNHNFRGLIDEVAIWDHALSAGEIAQQYQNGLNGQGYLAADTTKPATPSGLSVVSATPTEVSLTWAASTDNVGVAGYKIYSSLDGFTTSVGTPTGTSFTHTGLTPATAYSYTVAACDAAGNCSDQSSPAVSVTTPAGGAAILPAPAASFLGGAGDQRGTALAIADGGLYVTGVLEPLAGDSSATSLLAGYALPLGAASAWDRTIHSGTALYGVAATSDGVYPAGWNYSLSSDPMGGKEVKSYVAKFLPDGTAGSAADGAVWYTTPNLFSYGGGEWFNAAIPLTVDGTPYVYAVGGGQPASYCAYTVVKFDAGTGARLAAATDSSVGISLGSYYLPSAGCSGASGVVALNGALYLAGNSGWESEGDTGGVPAIFKYDPGTLNLLWRQKATGIPGTFNGVTAFQGAVYAVGHTGTAAGTEDFLVQKYAENGDLLWSRTSGGTNTDVLTGIVGIGSRLFAVGYTMSYGAGGKDMVVLELDPATGDTLATSLYGGAQDDLANGAATDGTDLYVIGESKSFASADGNAVGQNDVVVLRYALPVSAYTLTVSSIGTGTGSIASSPAGIDCGATCSAGIPVDVSITLTATAAAGSSFAGWGGACTGAGDCSVTMDQARDVTATFDLLPTSFTLSIATTGTGNGTVGADPTGPSYPAGTSVTLTARPTAGSTFAGWSGDCASVGTATTCALTMDGDKSVTATFAPIANPVGIVPYGTNGDTVLLDHFDGATSAGILAYGEPGTACDWSAKPSATPVFAYGSGPDGLAQALGLYPPAGALAGSQTYLKYPGGQLLSQPNGTLEFWTYLTTYDSAISIAQGPYYGACAGWTFGLSVSPTGQLQAGAWAAFNLNSGSMTVPLNAWTHVAVSWGSAGAKLYLNGQQVGSDPNTGMPAAGYNGFVLVNSGPGSGGAQIDELRISSVQRTSFSLLPTGHSLAVTRQGGGSGSVTSSLAGIDCGATCTTAFPAGSAVTLTATPDAGSIFAGWSGACAGSGGCIVTMDHAQNVTATFDTAPAEGSHVLTVTGGGSGGGAIASSPAGIACAPTCSAGFAGGTSVTLTATAATGSTFTGWGGACSGSDPCTLTMGTDRSVTATFAPAIEMPVPTTSLLGGAGDQRGTAMAISGGSLYATGEVMAGQTADDSSLLYKFALPLSVAPIWSRTIQNGTALFGVAATGDGAYPAGWSYSLSSDPAGDKEVKSYLAEILSDGTAGSAADGAQWVATPNLFSYGGVEYFSTATALTVNGTPYVFAAGFGQPCSYGAYTVTKFDPATGARLAAATDSSVGISLGNCSIPSVGSSGVQGIVGLNGNVYAAGFSAWPHEGDGLGVPALWKYDPGLTLQWRQKATDAPGGAFTAVAAFQGAIYAAGYVRPGGAGSEKFLVSRYAEDGSLVWSRTSGGPNTDVLSGIVGVGSRLFAVGYTTSYGAGGKDMVVLEIDPATGDTRSMTLYGGAQDDLANGAASDGTDLYVIGESRSFATADGNAVGQNDVVVLRYALPVSAYPLSVAQAGAGSGSVTSSPAGIDCGSACQWSFAPDASVTLTATPSGSSSFAGWSGACTGAGDCSVTMNQAQSVTATFDLLPATYTLTATTTGTGSGAVGVDPTGPTYPAGTAVTLTATPAAGSIFAGWSGACASEGSAATCSIIMDGDKSVTARFTAAAGSGTVAPYTADSGTLLLDHFDGTTGASILAYQETGGACWETKPVATPAYAYAPGPAGLNQAMILYPPAGAPTNSRTYLQYPGVQLLSQGNGTLEFWTYLTSYDTAPSVAQGPYPGACAGWTFGMGIDATGQLSAGAWAAFSMNSGAVKVPLNTWTHVAASWGSAGAKLYINGQLVGSDANTGMPAPGFGGSVLVYSGPGSAGSQLDELRISNVQQTSFNLLPPSQTLTVTTTGSGSVTSVPAGIACGAICSASYPSGTAVTLTATPAAGSLFAGWSGACTNAAGSCTVTLDQAQSATATFTLQTITLALSKDSTGSGSVASTPTGLDCGGTCTAAFPFGTSVTLTATPDATSTFTGWGGACAGSDPTCALTLTDGSSVVATAGVGSGPWGVAVNPAGTRVYVTNQYSDSLSVIDTATNTVRATVAVGSWPQGVAVHPMGSLVYVKNDISLSVIDTTTSTVTATVPMESGLYGGVAVHPTGAWVYVANSSSNSVSVLETATNTVIATVPGFNYPVGVAVNPTGTRVYVANYGGGYVSVIDTADNSVTTVPVGPKPYGVAMHPMGTRVYVTNRDSHQVSVIDTADNSVTTVPVEGNPWGVAVNPAGTRVYVTNWANSSVSVLDTATNTVIATAPVGASSYGVAVNPTGTRVYGANFPASDVSVIDTTLSTVTATFTKITYALSVATAGTGSGTVTSDSGGIDCGATCSASYDESTVVTLTTTPDATSTFAGWSGSGCSGTGTCAVTMDAAKSVTAMFTRIIFGLTVTKTGTGTVTSDVGGIACGSICSASLTSGTPVTLTAAPASGSSFAGWTGACTGTMSCVVTMDAAKSVTATFALAANAPVAYWTFDDDTANDTVGTHHGTITGSGVTFTTGQVGRAISFSSGASYVKIPSFNLPYLTVSAWVNSASYGYYTSMVTKNYFATGWNSPYTTWQLWFNQNTAQPGTNSGGGSTWDLASPDAVPMNQWFHLAAAYDGTTVKLYVNGVQKGSTTVATPGPLPATDGNIYIGKPESSNHSFTGLIDEVALWDHALSATEIAQQYQNGLNGQGYLAQPVVSTATLTVTRQGSGEGTVTSAPTGLDCGGICAAAFPLGTPVTLTATPDGTSSFTGWGGDCGYAGTATTCIVDMNVPHTVSAAFTGGTPPTAVLTVYPTGSGQGLVVSSPSGITCNGMASCSANFPVNPSTSITLTAIPASGSSFLGWTVPGCSGTGTCTVTVTQALDVTAMFGAGGTAAFSQADLAGTWSFFYLADYLSGNSPNWTAVMLTLDATGAMTTGTNTYVSSDGSTAPLIGAAFTIDPATGLVAGAAWAADGSVTFPYAKLDPSKTMLGTVVSEASDGCGVGLALKNGGSFATGDLAGTWAIEDMGDSTTTNSPLSTWGTVTLNTSGTVTGGSISTSTGGYLTFTDGTLIIAADGTVTGSATTDTGPTIAFPHGRLDASKSVMALTRTSGGTVGFQVLTKTGGTFAPPSDLAGTWYLANYSDGRAANGPYWSAASVTLDTTGTVTGGSFTNSQGLSGTLTGGSFGMDASGKVNGTITSASGSLDLPHGFMTPGKNLMVMAASGTFDLGLTFLTKASPAGPSYTLTVTKAGTGSGTVTSDVGGIACGESCSGSIVGGTPVTLTAIPASNSSFAGWSGACTALTGACTLTLDQAQSVTATFALANTPAALLSPAPNSTLTGTTQAFTWTAGTGALEYALFLGTTPGGLDLYVGSTGLNTGVTVENLPGNGSPIYVRLYTRFATGWEFTDSTLTAALSQAKAALVSPAPGSTLTGTSQAFTWSAGTGALEYALFLGTTPGGLDLYVGSTGLNTGVTVENLPGNGSPIYVRLYTRFATGWEFTDSTLTAALSQAKAALVSPAPGSTLAGTSQTFTWTAGTGALEYALFLGTTPGGLDLYVGSTGLNTGVTVENLPGNGSPIYVRLYTRFATGWEFTDYTLTAVLSKASLVSPAPGSTLTDTTVTFTWTTSSAALEYALFLGTTPGNTDLFVGSTALTPGVTVAGLPSDGSPIYVRVFTRFTAGWQSTDATVTAVSRATLTSPAPGSTLPGSTATFTWSAGTGALEYALFLGTTPGNTDLYVGSTGLTPSVTVNGLPGGTPLYARLLTRFPSGWQYTDYTFTTGLTKASLTSPANGSTLGSTSATFTWSAGFGALEYALFLGTTPGGLDLYLGSTGLTPTVTVNGLPAGGTPLYVRLYTRFATGWQYNDYSVTTASSLAALVSPLPGSTLSGATQTFTWTAGLGALEYALFLGTTPGNTDLFVGSTGLTPTVTVAGLPTGGSPLYARLYTRFPGGWQATDYSFTTGP